MTITLQGEEIYRDNYFLAAVKPAGLLSVPGRGPDKQDCFITRLKRKFPGALVVHRLDQATSGLMIFALSKSVQAALGHRFEHREIKKEYEALLEGDVPSRGRLVLKQRLDINNRPWQIVDALQGKEGITEWMILNKIEDSRATISRVKFLPLTGRTHQLRLHAREMGAPIQGDSLYGSGGGGRMMLHCTKLEFNHPAVKDKIILHSPTPF